MLSRISAWSESAPALCRKSPRVVESSANVGAHPRNDRCARLVRCIVIAATKRFQVFGPTFRSLARLIIRWQKRPRVRDHTIQLDLLGQALPVPALGDRILLADRDQPG